MIPSKHAHLYVAVTTHPGMKGKNNEDRYAVSAYYADVDKRVPSILAVISDGIGGHRSGEVAAEIVVEKISQIVAQSQADQPLATLQQAITEASLAVRRQAEADKAHKGMGATCACAWVIGNRLYIAAVGDSRIYLGRAGVIRRLTTDHTWIQEALDHGVITPEQARGHPNVHVIRRYLGSQHAVEADFRLKMSHEETDAQAQANQGLQLLAGDVVLLCSDGLTDLVEDSEIQSALGKKRLEDALKDLVNLANQRGGHDNITIIAMKVPGAQAALAARPALREKRKKTFPVLLITLGVIGALVALAVLGFAGFYFFWPRVIPTSTQSPPTQFAPSFEPSLTPVPTETDTPTPTPTFSATSLAPPALRVTLTVVPGTLEVAPTFTAWPTNTGVFIEPPTPVLTPKAP